MSLPKPKRKLSPMLEEYVFYQKKYSDCLILIQVGDFYETFFEHAKILANTLNITLTSRDKNSDDPIPMAGIPCQALESYAERLLAFGKSIAVISQKPSSTGKNIERYLERMLTPGVTFHSVSKLESELPVVAAVYFSNYAIDLNFIEYSLSYSSPQTGKIEYKQGQGVNSLVRDIHSIDVNELILPRSFGSKNLDRRSKLVQLLLALPNLTEGSVKFRELYSFDGFHRFSKESDFTSLSSEIKKSSSLLINYIDEVSVSGELSFVEIKEAKTTDTLLIDPTTRKNLELCENIKSKDISGSLFSVIDKTNSVLGKRKLLMNIKAPLASVSKINERQEFVKILLNESFKAEELHKHFETIIDFESITARIELGIVTPKEVSALRDSLNLVTKIREELSSIFKQKENKIFDNINQSLEFDVELGDKLNNSIADTPPVKLKDCGVIRAGYSKECDRLNAIKSEGKLWLLELEERERQKTNVNSLKVKFNNVHGYFIEMTKASAQNALSEYEKRQSTVNSERFVTTELKKLEAEILSADEKLHKLEVELFQEIKEFLKKYISTFRALANAVGELDMYVSFFKVSLYKNWIFPKLDNSKNIEVACGEHPVLSEILATDFIPNDISFLETQNLAYILTGPNMGGKSTFLRQSALIVILAHMGLSVPAKSATIGIVDRIFARIGASDDLLEGESTFMVEMRETAYIVNQATEKSLILIDELGRGTATKDGSAIAKSVLNYIVSHLKSRTIFATHFHNLCQEVSGVANIRVGLKELDGGLLLTHKIEEGVAKESFGLEVAKRAGLPEDIILEAKNFIEYYKEETKLQKNNNLHVQKPLFEKNRNSTELKEARSFRDLKKELNAFEVNDITPLEALNILHRIKKSI